MVDPDQISISELYKMVQSQFIFKHTLIQCNIE